MIPSSVFEKVQETFRNIVPEIGCSFKTNNEMSVNAELIPKNLERALLNIVMKSNMSHIKSS
jgi:hypothetical protein